MLNDRLRRVTDLFTEGTEVFFGMDDDQKPILIWVNKLNSFEVEEARRDAMTKRGIRIGELTKPESPELVALKTTMASWDLDRLAQMRVNQLAEEIYLEVLNDIEVDEGWREKIDMIRRGTVLLDDEGAPEDDPRRKHLTEVQQEYVTRVGVDQERKQAERLREVKEQGRSTIEEEFIDDWRKRDSLDIFMAERRVSEMFVALRDCKGVPLNTPENINDLMFDHSVCDHSQRLLKERKDVYNLPETVIERCGDAIDGITVNMRDAGNSDAPESSSASSERSSAEEEVSTPSTPVEMPLAVRTS